MMKALTSQKSKWLLIEEVPGAPALLVLGTEAVWSVEAAGVNKGADSRAASLHSSPEMRVCSLDSNGSISVRLPYILWNTRGGGSRGF